MSNFSIYHYSKRSLLRSMLKSGSVALSARAGDVPPLVWCSTAPLWEPLARSALDLDIPTHAALHAFTAEAHDDEPLRISVNHNVLFEWSSELLKRGASWSSVFMLAQVGYENRSDPTRWFVAPHPILLRDWKSVQCWRGRWEKLQYSGKAPPVLPNK